MSWRAATLGFVLLASTNGVAAYACQPAIPEHRIEGESDQAHKARVDTLVRDREAAWFKQRQIDDLQRATVVFIARDTDWWPMPRQRYRNGRPLPPVIPKFRYPASSYFKPIDWLRGGKSTDLFAVERYYTSCGPMSLGDTNFSEKGQLFVFFASKWPANRDTLIDAIALDKINDAALMGFVAPYRGKSPPQRNIL